MKIKFKKNIRLNNVINHNNRVDWDTNVYGGEITSNLNWHEIAEPPLETLSPAAEISLLRESELDTFFPSVLLSSEVVNSRRDLFYIVFVSTLGFD